MTDRTVEFVEGMGRVFRVTVDYSAGTRRGTVRVEVERGEPLSEGEDAELAKRMAVGCVAAGADVIAWRSGPDPGDE